MAALVIALLLVFAGALLRSPRRLASLICGSASAFSSYGDTVFNYCNGRSSLCDRVTLYG